MRNSCRSAVTLFSVISLIAASGSAKAEDLSLPYEMHLPRIEARSTWIEAAYDTEARGHASRLMRTYRSYSEPTSLALKDAPYVGLLIQSQMPTLYPLAYDKTRETKYKEIVENVSIEAIFDGLLQGIVDQTLTPEIAEKTKAINSCLARRSLQGRSSDCALDLSEQIHDPGSWSQFWGAVDCVLPLHFMSDCDTRRLIFDSAKRDLFEAKQNPEVRKSIEAQFEARFPDEFRRGFLQELAQKTQSFPQLVAEKFGGVAENFWDDKTPLIESDSTDPTRQVRMTLKSFAQGLKADILGAQSLVQSTDPRERGMGAALFYAAANRLLVMTGGQEAKWDGLNYAPVPGDAFDPTQPKKPPQFQAQHFGGWAGVGPQFFDWDWAGYNPMQGLGGLRLFSNQFVMGFRGTARLIDTDEASVQCLEDLAVFLDALIVFLRATQPGGVLAQHFGSGDQLAGILEPSSPVLFPREGRMLAIGVMAGILKNLVAPGIGHIEVKDPYATDFGLGISFHDVVTSRGRLPGYVGIQAVARTLLAASDLRFTISTDRDIPADLAALSPQLDAALQIGALALGAQGQEEDGRFKRVLEGRVDPSTHYEDTVIGMRAITRAYQESQMLALLLRAKQGWLAMDAFWNSGREVAPSQLWETLRLWNETQAAVRPYLDSELAPEIDWSRWDRRMAEARAQLMGQLQGGRGPESVALRP